MYHLSTHSFPNLALTLKTSRDLFFRVPKYLKRLQLVIKLEIFSIVQKHEFYSH